MSDVDVREAGRAWRADPTELAWRRLEEVLARAGQPWGRELRRAGLRLVVLRARRELYGRRTSGGTPETRRAALEVVFKFWERQSRRADRALRRSVEADLDPRSTSWRDADAIPYAFGREGGPSTQRRLPRWVREVARAEWFADRALRRRPHDQAVCECRHHGALHHGSFEGLSGNTGVEVGPLRCRSGSRGSSPCPCKRFRGRTARPWRPDAEEVPAGRFPYQGRGGHRRAALEVEGDVAAIGELCASCSHPEHGVLHCMATVLYTETCGCTGPA